MLFDRLSRVRVKLSKMQVEEAAHPFTAHAPGAEQNRWCPSLSLLGLVLGLVIYLPITVQAIDHLQLKLIDQDGQFVNLRGETVTKRLHIESEVGIVFETKVGKSYKNDLPCLMRNSSRPLRQELTRRNIQFLENLGLTFRVRRK